MSLADDFRKKLKPTPSTQLGEQDERTNNVLGVKSNNFDDVNRHKIEEGRNLFRIYPPHEQKSDDRDFPNSFAEPKAIAYLPGMVNEYGEDGKPKKDAEGKNVQKLGRKPVFSAKVHGKVDRKGEPLTKDAVEEFIRIAQEKANSITVPLKDMTLEETRKKFLLPIYGAFNKKEPSKSVNGITYTQSWEMYVDKIKGDVVSNLGQLTIGKAVKIRINKIAAVESANEPLGTDPFTSPEDGRALLIIYNKQATKPEDYYTTEIDSATEQVVLESGKTVKAQKVYPLSDEQIINFYKLPSLAKLYRNVFKRRDLDLQIFGLQKIDEEYKMGIFETEEFQSILTQLSLDYPKEVETTDNTSGEESEVLTTPVVSNPAVTKAVVTNEEHESTGNPVLDEVFEVLEHASREELKEFNKDEELGVLVKSEVLQKTPVLLKLIKEAYQAKIVGTTTSVTEQPSTEKQEAEAILGSEPMGFEPTGEVALSGKALLEAKRAAMKNNS